MVRRPKTLPANASLAEVRALLADDHVHLALLAHGDQLVGTVARTDLDADLDAAQLGAGPALAIATLAGRTTTPELPAATVHAQMVEMGQRRLAVVDGAGRLLGLLCLKRTLAGFCSDRDIAARAEQRVEGFASPTTTTMATATNNDSLTRVRPAPMSDTHQPIPTR